MSRRAGDHRRISSTGEAPARLSEDDVRTALGDPHKKPFIGIGWMMLAILAGIIVGALLTNRL